MSGPLAFVYPVMAQILWSLILVVWTGRARAAALRARKVRFAEIALDGNAYPDDVRKISNNMQNQFETPILFYVLCGVATFVGATGLLMVLLAWAYFATRVAHTAIHTTNNRVPRRFYSFLAGVIILFAMWIGIALHLASA
jgi:hypothetical protein